MNSLIYYARTRCQRLELLPVELPHWRCFLRWPARLPRRLWLRHVLLPSVERKRQTDQTITAPTAVILAQAEKVPRRVGLFCQDPSKYSYVVELGAAFKAMGIEVVSRPFYLDGRKFSAFLREFKPDFVFEINRSKRQIQDCDSKFHHIAWIQDHSVGRRRITDGFGGSDRVYSVMDPEIFAYDPVQVRGWSLLQFAVNPVTFRPVSGIRPRWDVSMIGYLAPPLSACELRAPIRIGDVSTTLGAIHARFLCSGIDHGNLHVRELESLLLEIMRSHNPNYLPDESLSYLVALYEHRVLRSMDRANYVKKITDITENVGLFGNGQWKYDEYLSRFLNGRIEGSGARSAIYCLSKLVLHNGQLLVHDRTLEAMACASCVILNHSKHENSLSGITPYFGELEHFAFFDKDTIAEVTKSLVMDDRRRVSIGHQARARVLASFTWQHRAQQILDDFLAR